MANIDLAEDVVQDTFARALHNWSLNGVPDNPSGWLYTVAKNQATDQLRRKRFTSDIDITDGANKKLLESGYSAKYTMDKLWQEDDIEDNLLRMMFACCIPDLTVESQISLILKTLCGFSTAEIASALMVKEQTVSKRLYRAKEYFRKNNISPTFPEGGSLIPRLNGVLTSIYLLFNEGYMSSANVIPIRKDLLNQAMYLCKLLSDNERTSIPPVNAALALMCFHAARIDSRTDSDGNAVLLANQDRSKWNWELITRGNDYLIKATTKNSLSLYHLEAAIAYEHCIARKLEDTNWNQIVTYYDWALKLQPGANLALNRFIALSQIEESEQILEQLETSDYRSEWETNHLFHSFIADLTRDSDINRAKTSLKRAISVCKNDHEKRLLEQKLSAL